MNDKVFVLNVDVLDQDILLEILFAFTLYSLAKNRNFLLLLYKLMEPLAV